MVYSIADARAHRAARTRTARWCSSRSASRPPRRRRRWRSARRSALGLANFSVFCNHVLTPVGDQQHPRVEGGARRRHGAARRLRRPGARVDGDRQPAVRILRRGIPAARGDRRLRAARRDAGDPDAGPPAERRAARRSRTSSRARSPATATQGARRWSPRCSSCAARSNGAAWARCRTARCASASSYAAFDAEARYGIEYRSVPDHKACECGAILRGVKTPAQCKVFGTACTPEHPLGSCMVSERRRLRRALHVRPVQGRGDRSPRRPRSRRTDAMRDGYVKPIDFRNGRVDMTHGSGGRAMAQLIDELFVRAFDNELLRQANDQAAFAVRGRPHGDGHRQPRGVAAVLSRRRHRLPVGARHDQRRRDGRRGPAVPRRGLHPRGRLSARGPEAHRRLDGGGGAGGRRARRHRRHQGGRAGQGRRRVHHHHRHRHGAGRRRRSAATARGRATASSSAATIGDHGVAIMSLRENLEFETTIDSDTAALHGLVAAMVAAVPAIHCLRDPTRGGLATTLNELARQSGCGMVIARGPRSRCQAQVRAACEFLGPRSAVRRQRRQAGRDLRAG